VEFILFLILLLIFPISRTTETTSGRISMGIEPSIEEQVDSTLKFAATAAESYFVSTGKGSYEGVTVAALRREGMPRPDGIELRIVTASGARYCIEASADGETAHYDSREGRPAPGKC
jgi:hypothetical protein